MPRLATLGATSPLMAAAVTAAPRKFGKRGLSPLHEKCTYGAQEVRREPGDAVRLAALGAAFGSITAARHGQATDARNTE